MQHLQQEGVCVDSVDLAVSSRPHLRPRSKSFIIKPAKFVDFQKIMSGSFIPTGVEVKKYYPPREHSVGSFKKQLQELDAIGALRLRGPDEEISPVLLRGDSSSVQSQHPDLAEITNTASTRDQLVGNIIDDSRTPEL